MEGPSNARGVVYFGVEVPDIPEAALPRESQVPLEIPLSRARYRPRPETPLQYDIDEEAPADDEPLAPSDFADPRDFAAVVLQNLAAVYGIPTADLLLLEETARRAGGGGRGRQWLLGVELAAFGEPGKTGAALPASSRAAYPLPLAQFALLQERGQKHALNLMEWAAALGAPAPHLVFAIET